MTNKNDSAKPVRLRADQQKPDSIKLTSRPALFEVGTLDNGVIIIKTVSPTKERRAE